MQTAPVAHSFRRTALIHDWLTDWGGSENVLSALASCLDKPDLFSLIDFLAPHHRNRLAVGRSHTSFIQHLPGAATKFWNYLALMPLAIERFDLRDFECIVSSSHAFAKGVLTNADQLHLSYVHTPMRYAWDLHYEYLSDYGLDKGIAGWMARILFHRLRRWDRLTANNVDLFIANSENVARRIWRTYRRRSTVLYPPVDTSRFGLSSAKDNFYLSVSRLVSYKRIDIIVQAFSLIPNKKLLVIGDGPELSKLKALAGANVEFLGQQPDSVVADHLARARGLVFAANEDFGITPVEAQAAGTPVIAYRRGGALETVIDALRLPGGTGVFFDEPTPEALSSVIREHEGTLADILPETCRQNAMRFSDSVFRQRFDALLQRASEAWSTTRHRPETFESAVLDD